MPYPLPDPIAAMLAKELPPGFEFYWLRGEVMSVEMLPRPPYVSRLFFVPKDAPQPPMDTSVSVYDRDTEQGWDVRLSFAQDIAAGDTISLFGHEPKGTGRLTKPRLLYNHNTDKYERAYTDISTMPGTVLTEINYKYVLSCRLPGTLDNRRKDIARKFHAWFLAASLPPGIRARNYAMAAIPTLYLASVLLRLLAALVNRYALALFLPDVMIGMVLLFASLMGVLIFVALKLKHLIYEPPRFRGDREYSISQLCGFDNTSNFLRYVYWDITPVYEDVAQGVAAWVRENPDEEAEFIAPPVRGKGEKGQIQQSPEIALPEGTIKRIPPMEGVMASEPS